MFGTPSPCNYPLPPLGTGIFSQEILILHDFLWGPVKYPVKSSNPNRDPLKWPGGNNYKGAGAFENVTLANRFIRRI